MRRKVQCQRLLRSLRPCSALARYHIIYNNESDKFFCERHAFDPLEVNRVEVRMLDHRGKVKQ